MPDVKLPYPEEGKTDQETMQNLLDTMLKYRKELEYILQNLDANNMPSVTKAINNFVTDTEGNFSSINQTADSIQLQVTGIDSRLGTAESSITLNSNNINLKVTENDVVSMLNINKDGLQIDANNIQLNGITRVYSPTNSNAYVEMGDNYGDIKSINNSNTIFHVYNEGVGIVLKSFNTDLLTYNDATKKVTPNGNWDFSLANATGFNTTAVFG